MGLFFAIKRNCYSTLKSSTGGLRMGLSLLQHILPFRFVKIRHGGFHAGGYKKRLLALASFLIRKINKDFEASKKKMVKVSKQIMQKSTISCPACFTGTLKLQKTLTPQLLELIEQMQPL